MQIQSDSCMPMDASVCERDSMAVPKPPLTSLAMRPVPSGAEADFGTNPIANGYLATSLR